MPKRADLGAVTNVTYDPEHCELEIEGVSLDVKGDPIDEQDVVPVLGIHLSVTQETAAGVVAGAASGLPKKRLGEKAWDTRIHGLLFEAGPATVFGVMIRFHEAVPGGPGEPAKVPGGLDTFTWAQTIEIKEGTLAEDTDLDEPFGCPKA